MLIVKEKQIEIDEDVEKYVSYRDNGRTNCSSFICYICFFLNKNK